MLSSFFLLLSWDKLGLKVTFGFFLGTFFCFFLFLLFLFVNIEISLLHSISSNVATCCGVLESPCCWQFLLSVVSLLFFVSSFSTVSWFCLFSPLSSVAPPFYTELWNAPVSYRTWAHSPTPAFEFIPLVDLIHWFWALWDQFLSLLLPYLVSSCDPRGVPRGPTIYFT